MVKPVLFISLLFLSVNLKAQFLTDIQGKVISEISYTDVIGHPYLYQDWVNADIELSDGAVYVDVPVKYSIFKNEELFFKNPKDGSMLSFVNTVKSFTLKLGINNELYKSGFPIVDDYNDKTFYKVLYDGKLKLLHKKIKTVLETKAYNSASTEKSFQEIPMYYVFKDGKMEKFKPTKKDITTLFNDKADLIESFIKKEKIDPKSNTDLVKLFEYYDTH